MISAISDKRAQRRHPRKKMPAIKKPTSRTSNRGKTKPSKAIIHQRPGCRTAFPQASKNKMTVMMFKTMNRRRVSIRSNPMANPKLQIFFVSSPFQDLFFLIGEKTIPLLVDLVQDLVDPLLGYIRYLLERLGAGNLIIKLVLG